MFFENFIEISLPMALQVIMLGFIGGVLSGFIGSGGAFFMTPGMMNLGVLGPVAVGSNITHKFGKAMVGSKRHADLGNVDKKLAVFMLVTAAIGIRLAVMVVEYFFEETTSEHGTARSAAADLYISVIFVVILAVVSIAMLKDIIKSRKNKDKGPSTKIVDLLNKFKLRPVIYFPVADTYVSIWVILLGGLATGYLAGTIGVGGFIGVPVMIYVFGVPAAVAAGSELYLAMYMGAFGAINYAMEGLVDIRLTLLLFTGSLFGIFIGAYGTKVVNEVVIRLVTSLIILLCVISRMIAIPVYLQELGYLTFPSNYNELLNSASKFMLYFSGVGGVLVILVYVFKAYFQRKKIQASLTAEIPEGSVREFSERTT